MNNEKAARILVECGYATKISIVAEERRTRIVNHLGITEICNPYVDTIESIHQAHAIEDWLSIMNNDELWLVESIKNVSDNDKGQHQWRLRRIEWCLKQIRWIYDE